VSAKSSALLESFGIVAETRIIALVGAGGKTALLYALARELQRKGRTVVTTTTTKIFPPTRSQSPCLILLTDDPALRTLPAQLLDVGHVTVGRSILFPVMKVEGVEEPIIELCKKAADHVLVEADGAAGRPIKAPEEWEPVIPRGTDLVIHLVGLDCLGKPVADDWVSGLHALPRSRSCKGAGSSTLTPSAASWLILRGD
jgi:probable selenium-dependent hydroxylase accessory protein YqeC